MLIPAQGKKAAQIGNFALVNPKVSLCIARRREPRLIQLSSKHISSSASDSCKGAVTYTS